MSRWACCRESQRQSSTKRVSRRCLDNVLGSQVLGAKNFELGAYELGAYELGAIGSSYRIWFDRYQNLTLPLFESW
jgi:hypothetical protein